VIVYPAIDIRGGRCVRLVEGDFARETPFDADPVDAARRWIAAGAEWLHVVDLDGAVAGRPVNLDAIRRLCGEVAIPVQLGGGLRTEDDLTAVFDLGVRRAVLGTAALRSRELVASALARWGNRIAVGLDARDGRLAANGWLEQTDLEATRAAAQLRAAGVRRFVFTDIRRDGTLAGPNLEALRAMIETVGDGVIASGGIGRIEDVAAVAETGAEGVILGRALYDGRVELSEAIALARRPTAKATA
jgi:phosphoribosylformimino-5-aminoimidazole carboxamide ribotide isomerase